MLIYLRYFLELKLEFLVHHVVFVWTFISNVKNWVQLKQYFLFRGRSWNVTQTRQTLIMMSLKNLCTHCAIKEKVFAWLQIGRTSFTVRTSLFTISLHECTYTQFSREIWLPIQTSTLCAYICALCMSRRVSFHFVT